MMLDPIYLNVSMEDKLDVILEDYNQKHPEKPLSYQEMAQDLLEDAIYNKFYAIKHGLK